MLATALKTCATAMAAAAVWRSGPMRLIGACSNSRRFSACLGILRLVEELARHGWIQAELRNYAERRVQ